jgi:uncharacterized RDD family membrane protein YckC
MSEDFYPSEYAGFWRRFLAMFLDFLVMIVPGMIFQNIIPIVGGIIAWFLYAPLLESSDLKGTLGKYWVGIQVIDTKGRRLTFQAALLRNLMKLVSTTLCFVGHLAALFTAKSQAVHDLLAESLVVYGRTEQSVWEAWLGSFKRVFPSAEGAGAGRRDALSRLERLQTLREKGAISEEEFQTEKGKILSH